MYGNLLDRRTFEHFRGKLSTSRSLYSSCHFIRELRQKQCLRMVEDSPSTGSKTKYVLTLFLYSPTHKRHVGKLHIGVMMHIARKSSKNDDSSQGNSYVGGTI